MDEVPVPQELQGTGKLFQKMTDDDLVQSTNCRIGISSHHVLHSLISHQLVSRLDEHGKISELAKLHDEVDVRSPFPTFVEGDDMRMMERPQDLNLCIQVLLQFLVELRHINGLDGHYTTFFLQTTTVSTLVNRLTGPTWAGRRVSSLILVLICRTR